MGTAAEVARLVEVELARDAGLSGVCFDCCGVADTYWVKRVPLGADGEPLVGNGVAASHDYVPLNVFTDADNGAGEGRHWELGEGEV